MAFTEDLMPCRRYRHIYGGLAHAILDAFYHCVGDALTTKSMSVMRRL